MATEDQRSLARLVKNRARRVIRDAEELRRLAGQLEDSLTDTSQEDTDVQRTEELARKERVAA